MDHLTWSPRHLQQMLKFLGINPEKESFTIKISGGPDGDVAGTKYSTSTNHTPKQQNWSLLTDFSGTIFDPEGLDLCEIAALFKNGHPIRHYPPQKLHEGGSFLTDLQNGIRQKLTQETLCYRKLEGKVVEDWLLGSEMNSLWRNNLHHTKADIFIPAEGALKPLGTPISKTSSTLQEDLLLEQLSKVQTSILHPSKKKP